MSPEISERSFEDAIECGLLEFGPDAREPLFTYGRCLAHFAVDPDLVYVTTQLAAFLNTEGGDLLIGVGDDGSLVGIEREQLESDDTFMRYLAQAVGNGLGDRAGTCIDSKMQIVQGKAVCVVSCQRSPEPVFLKWKGMETTGRRLLRAERAGLCQTLN
jgi:GTPase